MHLRTYRRTAYMITHLQQADQADTLRYLWVSWTQWSCKLWVIQADHVMGHSSWDVCLTFSLSAHKQACIFLSCICIVGSASSAAKGFRIDENSKQGLLRLLIFFESKYDTSANLALAEIIASILNSNTFKSSQYIWGDLELVQVPNIPTLGLSQNISFGYTKQYM